MTDRPILFSAPMVRALLAGTKTQTRRVLDLACDEPPAIVNGGVVTAYDENDAPYRWPRTAAVGDRLYVREAWRTGLAYEDLSPAAMGGEEQVLFEADGATERWTKNSSEPGRFRQGMHMPRWASRLTLIVTDVRVQRLQDISPYDALAEGVCAREQDGQPPDEREVKAYAELWDTLNAGRGYGWEANPWVVAYSFTIHHGNIDQIGRPA